MTALTERQRQVLDALRSLTEELGMSPTIRELGARIGHSSTRSTHAVLCALIRKGYITHEPWETRSLRIVDGPVPVPVVLPKEVRDAVKWHAMRLTGGNAGEMVARIVAGWVELNPIPNEEVAA